MAKKAKPAKKEKDISNNELARMVANGFASVDNQFVGLEKRINKVETIVQATRDELKDVKTEIGMLRLKTATNLNDIQTDIKSFKQETRDNFAEVNEKLDDIDDTNKNYDKRIEKLELKAR